MAKSEYHLLSSTDLNMGRDLQKYTQDGWKPILMSSCAINASVQVIILLEREK